MAAVISNRIKSWQVTGGGDSSIRQWRLQGNNDLPLTQVQLAIPISLKVHLMHKLKVMAKYS